MRRTSVPFERRCARRRCAHPATPAPGLGPGPRPHGHGPPVHPCPLAPARQTGRASGFVEGGCPALRQSARHVRRNTSPVAVPRAPPSGLRRAVSRARAIPGTTSAGTYAFASRVASGAGFSNVLPACQSTLLLRRASHPHGRRISGRAELQETAGPVICDITTALPCAVAVGGEHGLSTNANWPCCWAQARQP